jgi:NDP-sugar pyrophosphorylase family protein
MTAIFGLYVGKGYCKSKAYVLTAQITEFIGASDCRIDDNYSIRIDESVLLEDCHMSQRPIVRDAVVVADIGANDSIMEDASRLRIDESLPITDYNGSRIESP